LPLRSYTLICDGILNFINGDRSFLWKKSANSAWHFVTFRGSLWQITVNSAVDSYLKENKLSYSKYLM